LQKERGVIGKKGICSRSIECAPIKEHGKKWSVTPQIKARGESQSKECLEKQTKIFHTLAHLGQVAWLFSSWIQSLAQQHHVAQVSLSYPTQSSTYKS
jgi:hypothetical protein